MTNLISGKEALIALANGEQVECSCASLKDANEKYWTQENITNFTINDFLGKHWIFRRKPRTIKPRTITINGIEVPAPFEPKEGETYWYITDSECGYDWVENKEGCRVGIAAWRTEDEIKQVVAALRQVFGEV